MFDPDPSIAPSTFDEEISTLRVLWDGYLFDHDLSEVSMTFNEEVRFFRNLCSHGDERMDPDFEFYNKIWKHVHRYLTQNVL